MKYALCAPVVIVSFLISSFVAHTNTNGIAMNMVGMNFVMGDHVATQSIPCVTGDCAPAHQNDMSTCIAQCLMFGSFHSITTYALGALSFIFLVILCEIFVGSAENFSLEYLLWRYQIGFRNFISGQQLSTVVLIN